MNKASTVPSIIAYVSHKHLTEKRNITDQQICFSEQIVGALFGMLEIKVFQICFHVHENLENS